MGTCGRFYSASLLPCGLLLACAGGSSAAGSDQNASSAAGQNGEDKGPNAGMQAAVSGEFGNATGGMSVAGTMMPSMQDPRGCNDLRVDFEPRIPIVMVVIDRSGSMFEMPYAGSPTRWAALDTALMQPGSGVVASFEDRVSFGMLTYTSDFSTSSCPIFKEVAPQLQSFGAMRALYDDESVTPTFKAETPTGAAIIAATERMQAIDDDNPKHILLVTDGEPDDCVTPDPQCGQDQSIAAVQAAHAAGIGTSVVGISSDVSARHLQDLANAGVGLPVQAPDMQYTYNCVNPGYATLSAAYATSEQVLGENAEVLQPETAADLDEALRSLIRGVTECAFELKGEVDLERAGFGTVLLDGQPLLHEDANGWRMQNSRVLELLGGACERVQNESEELEISFPCDVVDVI